MKAFLHMESSLFPKKAWNPVLINDVWDAMKHTNTHAARPPSNKHNTAAAYAQMEFCRTGYKGPLLSKARNSTAAKPSALWGISPSLEKLPAHQEHWGNCRISSCRISSSKGCTKKHIKSVHYVTFWSVLFSIFEDVEMDMINKEFIRGTVGVVLNR